MSDYLLNLSVDNPFVERLIKIVKVLEISGQWISLIRGTEILILNDILKPAELEPQPATYHDESSGYLADATSMSVVLVVGNTATSCAQSLNTHQISATDVNVPHGYTQSAEQYIHHLLSLRKLAVAFILLINFPRAFLVANEVRILSRICFAYLLDTIDMIEVKSSMSNYCVVFLH